MDGTTAPGLGGTAVAGEDLDLQATRMFALVSEGILGATSVFLTGDRDGVRTVVANEARINAGFHAIERSARDELLGGDAPSQARAQLLIVVLQIAPELERTGDLVEHIAQRGASGLAAALSARSRGLIEEMGRLAAEMWRVAASAYLERASDAALRLRARDDQLDDLHVTLTAQLAHERLSVAAAIEVGLVARFYERLGDHAVNVTRRLEELRDA